MLNYVKSSINGTEILVPTRFEEGFYIDLKDFEYLFKLYKFIPIKESKCWFDRKYSKTVARAEKNLLSNEYEILFNKNWLAYECIVTKSKELLKILSKYPECQQKYAQTLKILARIAEKDAKYIAKGDYTKKPMNNFEDLALDMPEDIPIKVLL